MLELTPNAVTALAESRSRNGLGDDVAVRISGADSGNGMSGGLQLRFAADPWPSDVVVEAAGTRVFVAEELTERLQQAVLDAEETPEGRRLILKRSR